MRRECGTTLVDISEKVGVELRSGESKGKTLRV